MFTAAAEPLSDRTVRPGTAREVAEVLADVASSGRTIRLGGGFTKDRFGGLPVPGDIRISTDRLSRVLQFEPKDLTISVQAGIQWSDLSKLLAEHGQMIPLDPPFFGNATVGGVLASNSSGPRRRLYGTARDQVIGMEFATLEGKLVQSGGMVVKNVAGLDMGKLMIGSFGTLAVITSANFKLTPIPDASAVWVLSFGDASSAVAGAATVRKSVLQPAMLDLLNPAAADRVGIRGWCVVVQAGGVAAVLSRYDRELVNSARLTEVDGQRLFAAIREFGPSFLSDSPRGGILRVSSPLNGLAAILQRYSDAEVLCRAGSGVSWVCHPDADKLAPVAREAVLEFAPENFESQRWQLPASGTPAAEGFAVMQEIRSLFNPKALLNPGRLYGRL